MARPARSIERGRGWILGLMAWWACAACTPQSDQIAPLIPQIEVDYLDSALHNVNGQYLYQGRPLDGYVVEHKHGKLVAKVPVWQGREEGIALAWYENGQHKSHRAYHQGSRDGAHVGWHANGQLSYEYCFENDLYVGEQRSYFDNGQAWQVLHYVAGREEGRQKTWNAQGRLINNYTVKDGKLYGVIGRYDCMAVMAK